MTAVRQSRLALMAASLLAIIAAGVLVYVLTARDDRTVTVRTGLAYATAAQAVVQKGGWSYNIPLDGPWIDSQGTVHETARPSCLAPNRGTPIEFGTVNITVGGLGMRRVVWVRCT